MYPLEGRAEANGYKPSQMIDIAQYLLSRYSNKLYW